MKTFADPLTPDEHDLYVAGYEHGYGDALDRGRALAEADLDAAWAELAVKVRAVADRPTYVELQRRRGEAA